MVGMTVEGSYTANNIIITYIKRACMAVTVCSILIMILCIMTKNNEILGGVAVAISISVLLYLFIEKFINIKPIECRITFESVNKGTLKIKISSEDEEDIEVYSDIGTWSRDNLIVTLIDSKGGSISFKGDKSVYKKLKQENVQISVEND